MALKYKDKISLHHDNTVCARRQEILQILEESKEMVYNLHSMVQLNALKTRCQKIATPRKGPAYDKAKEQARYQSNREHITEQLRYKRQKIRDIEKQDAHLITIINLRKHKLLSYSEQKQIETTTLPPQGSSF